MSNNTILARSARFSARWDIFHEFETLWSVLKNDTKTWFIYHWILRTYLCVSHFREKLQKRDTKQKFFAGKKTGSSFEIGANSLRLIKAASAGLDGAGFCATSAVTVSSNEKSARNQ